MIITISGTPGSGKSTIARILAERLKAERIYVGGIRRELARKKGMTLEELNVYAQTHPETDVDVDTKAAEQAKALDKKGKIVIVEGRTQFYFLPSSLKMYISVSPEEGARRIWKDLQLATTKEARNEGKITSLAQLKKSLVEREENDAQRYQKYYGFDHRGRHNYDYVVNTTAITAKQAAEKILKIVKQKTLNK